MVRRIASLLFTALITSYGGPVTANTPISICELAKDFRRFRDKIVTTRGVYYYGLRQEECPQKCSNGLWPSFIDLEGGGGGTGTALGKVFAEVEAKAKQTGNRYEIWVTVVGRLQTSIKRSHIGPCDRNSWYPGYGHLGAFPAHITVESFRDIEVRENSQSPYDYAHIYHGPA